jgi:hypothetical protein
MLLPARAMTAAPAVRAQQKAIPVIGLLNGTSPDAAAPFVAAFHQGLSESWLCRGTRRRDRLPVGGGAL